MVVEKDKVVGIAYRLKADDGRKRYAALGKKFPKVLRSFF